MNGALVRLVSHTLSNAPICCRTHFPDDRVALCSVVYGVSPHDRYEQRLGVDSAHQERDI
jgi:hypothetical protein